MLSKYATPIYLIEYFDSETKKSHERNELNKRKLRKAMKRRERIRAILVFGGLILAFAGIAAIETLDLTSGPVVCCLIGMLMVFGSNLILHGDSDV